MAEDILTQDFTDAGGGIDNPAAAFMVSGAASGTSAIPYVVLDDYWIQEQTLDIDYVRVPQGVGKSHTLTLATYTTSADIQSTHLAAIVTASYKIKKVRGEFGTSSYVQPQTFEITTASAPHGVSYGGAPNASGLGPAGSINTKNKWIHRRPWATGDVEISKNVVGATVAFNSSGAGSSWRWAAWPQTQHFMTLENYFLHPQLRYSPRTNYESFLGSQLPTPYYWLPGTFHVNQETSKTNIWNFIDGMGKVLAAFNPGGTAWSGNGLIAIPPLNSEGLSYVVIADRVGIEEYDISRHSY